MERKDQETLLAARNTSAPGHPWAVTEEGREAVRQMRSNGINQAVIAQALGMHPQTFRECIERDDDLKAAYEAGTGFMESELVGLLMGQAREGNTTAAIFLLKGACGFRENTPVSPKTDGPAINITIPPAISPDDLVRLTSQMKVVSPAVETDRETAAANISDRKAVRIAR